MTIQPESIEDIKRRVRQAHLLGRRARLEALAATGRALKAELRDLGERLLAFTGAVDAMLEEIREDESTVRLPTIADPQRAPTDRISG